jgi:putative hydrolase of the HAD superfamily
MTEQEQDDAFEEMFTAMYEHFANADAWQLYADTLPALETLRAHAGLQLFVLSNFDRRLHSILSGLGIAHFFDGVILSSEVGASKPHIRMFTAALHAAAVPASSCLHIGDDVQHVHDGATAAGMHAMLVNRPDVTLLTVAEKVTQGHFPLASPSKMTT